MSHAEFAYAQARLQARLGRRPAESSWQPLESSRSASHALTLARTGALAPWVEGLDDGTDVHGIERHLRARWQREVLELASWLPQAWHAALRCFGRLPVLALGGEQSAPELLVDWQAQWHAALPASARGTLALQQPARWLLPRLTAGPARAAAAHETLQRALQRLLRRHSASAPAAFAYLALVALDLERLRGILVVRALFAPQRVNDRREPA
jgi:hypothetical protein